MTHVWDEHPEFYRNRADVRQARRPVHPPHLPWHVRHPLAAFFWFLLAPSLLVFIGCVYGLYRLGLAVYHHPDGAMCWLVIAWCSGTFLFCRYSNRSHKL